MKGRDIDGGYLTDEEHRLVVTLRRAELRAANKCINGPVSGQVGRRGVVHGDVVRGGKCQHCIDVHRHGKDN